MKDLLKKYYENHKNGLDELHLSFGHDEYLYKVLKFNNTHNFRFLMLFHNGLIREKINKKYPKCKFFVWFLYSFRIVWYKLYENYIFCTNACIALV